MQPALIVGLIACSIPSNLFHETYIAVNISQPHNVVMHNPVNIYQSEDTINLHCRIYIWNI